MPHRRSVRIIFGNRGRLTTTGWTGLFYTLSKIWQRRHKEAEHDYLTGLKARKIEVDTAVADMRSEKLAKENYLLELKIKKLEHDLKMSGVTAEEMPRTQ